MTVVPHFHVKVEEPCLFTSFAHITLRKAVSGPTRTWTFHKPKPINISPKALSRQGLLGG